MENAFERNKEREEKLRKLAEKPLTELYLLSQELKITAEDLLMILAGDQGITPELGRRIDELYNIKFPPELPIPIEIEIPEVKECTMVVYTDYMIGKKEKYFSPEHRDFLTSDIRYDQYDGALGRVRSGINRLFEGFFGNNLSISESETISYDEAECTKFRRYEFVIIDTLNEGGDVYQFQYMNGRTVYHTQGLSKIKADIEQILRVEGAWEK